MGTATRACSPENCLVWAQWSDATRKMTEHFLSHCELQLSPTHVKRDEKRLSEQECPSSPAGVGTSPPPSATTICDLPLKCRGGAKCFEIWSRDHGLAKCGKSFQNENDLIVHAKNNHNYCLEHERMWYKCLPCKLREMDDN